MHAKSALRAALRLAMFLALAMALGWSWSAAGAAARRERAAPALAVPLPAAISQTCLVGNAFEDRTLQDWTSSNTSVFEVSVGGPTGSNFYLHAKDGSGASTVDAPSPYVGDWIVITGGCGTFCYDVNLLDDGEAGSAPLAANFYLHSGGTIAQFVAFDITEPAGANPGWHQICAPVRAADAGGLPSNGAGEWRINGLTSGQQTVNAWNILIRNVTAAKFPVDWASSNQNEEVGYDNFCLSGEGCVGPTPTDTPPPPQLTGVIRTERGCSESGPLVTYGTGETVPIALSIAGAPSAEVRVIYRWPDGGQETQIDGGTIQSGQQYSVDPPLSIPPDAVPGGRHVSLQEHIAGPEYREIARCSFDVVSLATDTPTPIVPTATPTTAPCVAPGCLPPSSVLPVHNLPQEPNQNPPVSCAVADCHDGVRVVPDGCADCPGGDAAAAERVKWIVGPEVLGKPMPKPTRKPSSADQKVAGVTPTVAPRVPPYSRGAAGGSWLSAGSGSDWRHIPRTAFDSSAQVWGSGAAVNVHSGELTLTDVDLEIAGRGFDFRIARRYRSGVTFDGPLGWNWEVDLGRRLVEMTPANWAAYAQQTGLPLDAGDVLRMDGTGRVDAFARAVDGSFVAPAGVYVSLTRDPDGRYTEIDREGTAASYAAPNEAGVAPLTSVADRAGNTQQFEHNANGRLVRVLDTLGRPIDFGYDVRGHLSFVQDFTGRRVNYAYDTAGNLIAVTSPAVTGTVNRNDFPSGKTTRYAYSEDMTNGTLNHNLTAVIAPNEVASGGPARLTVTYDAEDRVATFRTGGTNAGGVPAGGTSAYTYRALPVPPVTNTNTPRSETEVVDANGNRHVYQFNVAGNAVGFVTESNRDIRPGDPAAFQTRSEYNAAGEVTRITGPSGGLVEFEYDVGNPDPRQHGNQIAAEQRPDAARGGDQVQLRTTTRYEPIFGHIYAITDPRGNDPSYVPPNGGSHSVARYTTRYTYDYQEGDNAAALALKIGRPEAEVRALLAAAGVVTNVGDVNGDGLTDQVMGNLVQTAYPTVRLAANSLLAVRQGQDQPSFELFGYNQYGQPVYHVDAEGNLSRYTYHPENDPDGDGRDRTPGMSDAPFGYLANVIRDAGANPGPSPTPRPTPGPDTRPIYLPITARSGRITLAFRAPAAGPASIGASPASASLADRRQAQRDGPAAPLQAGGEPAAPSWRNEGYASPFTNSRTSYLYDPVGNPIRIVNPRGVATDFEVNALNQVVEVTLAADVQPALEDPDEPFWMACRNMQLPECTHGMTAFAYRTRFHYDANDNVVKVETEDRDGTSEPPAGPWIESTFSYDILDNLVGEARELATGQSATTAYRYDRNGNRVLQINPVAFLPADDPLRQADHAVSTIYDERDLVAAVTRGGVSVAFRALPAHADIPEIAALPSRAEMATVSYGYDADGNLNAVLDAVDNSRDGVPERTTFLYDGFGRQVSEVNGLGTQTFVRYDPAGNAIHSHTYGPLQGISPRDDGAATFLQPLTATSFNQPLLTESRAGYDERGRAYKVEEHLFAYAYANGGYARPPILVDGPGDLPGDGWVTSQFEWDRADRLLYVIEDDDDAWLTEYDGLSRAVLEKDPAGNRTVRTYDRAGNETHLARTEVPRAADVASSRVPNVSATYSTWAVYDALDRLIRSTDDLGQTVRMRYDSRDNAVWTADAQYSTRQNDLIVDPLAVFPGPGGGAAASRLNRPGNVTTSDYDGLGRPVRTAAELHRGGQGGAPLDTANTANPDGLVVSTRAYDANGREISRTDDLGGSTRFTYDALDRVTRTTLSDGRFYESSWDLDDNLVRHVDPQGSEVRVEVDGLGRTTLVENWVIGPGVFPGPREGGSFRGGSTYDGLGRPTWVYEGLGGLPRADVFAGVNYAYDSLGRVLDEKHVSDEASGEFANAVSSRWSGDGRRLAVAYSDDRVIEYSSDALGQIDRVVEAADGSVIADYDLMGADRVLRRSLANGTSVTQLCAMASGSATCFGDDAPLEGYDAIGRVVQSLHMREGELLQGSWYGYNRMNQPTYHQKLYQPSDSEWYPYDSLGRLAGYQRGALNRDRSGPGAAAPNGLQQRSWLLDGAGNWAQVASTVNGTSTIETRTHSPLNAVNKRDGYSLAYDRNGNLTADAEHQYAWDYANRLRTVTRLSDGALIATYGYDPFGRRAKKIVTNSGPLNGVTIYVHDGWREIEERDAANNLVAQVVYGQGLDEPVMSDRDLDADGVPTGAADRRLYYHQDLQSSTIGLTDRTGSLVEGYRYDPYGRATVYAPGPNGAVDFGGDDVQVADGASALDNPFLYAGRRFDRESGLYDYRTRYLDPVLGRFISQDTIGAWGDEANLGNAYAYVGGRAHAEVDPMGLATTVKGSKSNSDNILGGPSTGGAGLPGGTIQAMAGIRPPRRPHLAMLLPTSVADALDKRHIPRGIPSALGLTCPPGVSRGRAGVLTNVQKQKHDSAKAAIQNIR